MDTYENDNLDIKPAEDTAASDGTEYAADETVPAASEIADTLTQEPAAEEPAVVLIPTAFSSASASAAIHWRSMLSAITSGTWISRQKNKRAKALLFFIKAMLNFWAGPRI